MYAPPAPEPRSDVVDVDPACDNQQFVKWHAGVLNPGQFFLYSLVVKN
jgi:hypothetical protein